MVIFGRFARVDRLNRGCELSRSGSQVNARAIWTGGSKSEMNWIPMSMHKHLRLFFNWVAHYGNGADFDFDLCGLHVQIGLFMLKVGCGPTWKSKQLMADGPSATRVVVSMVVSMI